MKKLGGAGAVLAVIATVGAVAPAAFGARSASPSGGTPPPGSTIRGGLEVDGTCVLDNVTIGGGLAVDGTGAVELNGSTVNGGLVVSPGGELDVDATTSGAGNPTGAKSTIKGTLRSPARSTSTSGPRRSTGPLCHRGKSGPAVRVRQQNQW
jgi:hypothetical protein